MNKNLTIVTGLWNINRNGRPFDHYIEHFKNFLKIPQNLFIYVPKELESLALSKDGDDWDSMCNKLEDFGFLNPIGNMHVTHLMVNGKEEKFH